MLWVRQERLDRLKSKHSFFEIYFGGQDLGILTEVISFFLYFFCTTKPLQRYFFIQKTLNNLSPKKDQNASLCVLTYLLARLPLSHDNSGSQDTVTLKNQQRKNEDVKKTGVGFLTFSAPHFVILRCIPDVCTTSTSFYFLLILVLKMWQKKGEGGERG